MVSSLTIGYNGVPYDNKMVSPVTSKMVSPVTNVYNGVPYDNKMVSPVTSGL